MEAVRRRPTGWYVLAGVMGAFLLVWLVLGMPPYRPLQHRVVLQFEGLEQPGEFPPGISANALRVELKVRDPRGAGQEYLKQRGMPREIGAGRYAYGFDYGWQKRGFRWNRGRKFEALLTLGEGQNSEGFERLQQGYYLEKAGYPGSAYFTRWEGFQTTEVVSVPGRGLPMPGSKPPSGGFRIRESKPSSGGFRIRESKPSSGGFPMPLSKGRLAPPASVTVTCNVTDATVFINDRSVGTISPGVKGLSIEFDAEEAETVEVAVRKEGYRPFVKSVELHPGQETTIWAQLVASPSPNQVEEAKPGGAGEGAGVGYRLR